jgi:hypothetical protein
MDQIFMSDFKNNKNENFIKFEKLEKIESTEIEENKDRDNTQNEPRRIFRNIDELNDLVKVMIDGNDCNQNIDEDCDIYDGDNNIAMVNNNNHNKNKNDDNNNNHTNGGEKIPIESKSHYVHKLYLEMIHLKSVLVQIKKIQNMRIIHNKITQYDILSNLFKHNMKSLLSLASTDLIDAAKKICTNVGKNSKSMMEIFYQILIEGDTNFIENLFSQLYKTIRTNNTKLNLFNMKKQVHEIDWYDGVKRASDSPIVVLGGDIKITEGIKIRASVHFSSVASTPRIAINLDHMQGRWFYECTLLSDGLMQIGWANSSFKCDPVNGIGVGDHIHSWAYDGYRSSRWNNKTAEPYGRRWHPGDVVGVLLDVDLLEMRFYLNGADLGTAFVEFKGPDLVPALSLNVRQAVRINFGQYRFIYPPDETDGKRYKAVWLAADDPRSWEINDKNDGFGDEGKGGEGLLGGIGQGPDTDGGSNPASQESRSIILEQIQQEMKDNEEGSDHEDDNTRIEALLARIRRRSIENRLDNDEEKDRDTEIADNTDTDYIDWDLSRRAGIIHDSASADRVEAEEDAEYMTAVENDMRRRLRMHGRRYRHDDIIRAVMEEEEEEESQLIELQRQSLIESLISIGFPVDWALKAVEHSDMPLSQENAMSWILERMTEIDQIKVDEGGDSHRGVDEDLKEDSDVNTLGVGRGLIEITPAAVAGYGYSDITRNAWNGSDVRGLFSSYPTRGMGLRGWRGVKGVGFIFHQ